jgi:uncharacterized protein (DUF2461 family)
MCPGHQAAARSSVSCRHGVRGFPAEAFGFYERLEADNSRRFWDAHKSEYQMYVRGPVRTLVGELKAEFGQATVFRP